MTSYVKNGTLYEFFLIFFFQNVYQILISNLTRHKNFIKQFERAQNGLKRVPKSGIFCISYIKYPYKGRFAKASLTIPLNLTSHEQAKVFLNLKTHLLITK